MPYLPIDLLFMLVMSIAAYQLYRVDKHKAQKRKWRIRETTLLWVGFLGGAIGALCAMQRFRHKTRHWYFWAVNLLGLAWQAALLVLLVIHSRNG